MCDLQSDDDHLFSSVPMVMGGDFAQTLPVVQQGNHSTIVAASLQQSVIQSQLQLLRLRQNMQLQAGGDNAAFADWLGRMSYKKKLISQTELPSYVYCETDSNILCNQVFPPAVLYDSNHSVNFFSQQAILTVCNTNTSDFNKQILSQMPGDVQIYYSVDEANTDDVTSSYKKFPCEYLQSISLSGLPPAELKLKVGALIMLRQNLYL